MLFQARNYPEQVLEDTQLARLRVHGKRVRRKFVMTTFITKV